MRRALACVVLIWMVVSGCDKPCKPGYAKAGYDCKKLPESDAGMDSGVMQGSDGGTRQGMDGGVVECLPPECDPCAMNPCANGGVCEPTERGYSCTCPIGFMGARCQIDPCELDPCLHDGVCKRVADGRECACQPPWEGASCEVNTDPRLRELKTSVGTLFPPFAPSTFEYSVDLGIGEPEIGFTVEALRPEGVEISIGDVVIAAGAPSPPFAAALNASPPQEFALQSVADDGSQATYRITVRRSLVQQVYVKSNSGLSGRYFGGHPDDQTGQVLALRGDTLVISDSQQDGNGRTVYILSRSEGVWGITRTFFSETQGARYGEAVLVSDDLLAIGSPGIREVHVYRRDDLVFPGPPFETLTMPEGSPSIAEFGKALAASQDTLFIGAPGSGSLSPDEGFWGGEVHVFERAGLSWAWKQKITSPVDPDAKRFGARIAAESGVLVVGDPDAGTVHVYRRDAGMWAYDTELNLDDDATGLFVQGGGAVGIDQGRIAVAETYVKFFSGFIGEPRVSLFERDSGSWVRTSTFALPRNPQVPTESAPDWFGMTGLGFSGRTVIVGAQYAPGFGAGVSTAINYGATGVGASGAAYAFVQSTSGLGLAAHVKASNPGVDDHFGSRVAIDGNTVVVSAPSEDSSGKGIGADQDDAAVDRGAVYIYGVDCTQVPAGAEVSGC